MIGGKNIGISFKKNTINNYNLSLCKLNLEELVEEYIRVRYAFKNINNLGTDFYVSDMAYRFSDTPSSKIS